MLQRHALDNSTTGFVDCVSDDPQIAYYRRRAVECSTAAKNANDRSVAKVHEQFAIEYASRANRLGSANSAASVPPEHLSSRTPSDADQCCFFGV